MVLCTGLTERGPKDPEVETWAGTEAGSEQLALRGDKSHPATPFPAARDTSPTPGALLGISIHIPGEKRHSHVQGHGKKSELMLHVPDTLHIHLNLWISCGKA